MTINESKVMGNSSRHLAFDNHPSKSSHKRLKMSPRNASTEKNTSGKAGNPQHHASKGRVEKKKPRPRLNGAGIPENARLLSLKAGTDLPIIKDLSNNIMAQFRAMNALLGIPFCHENLNRFMRNQRPRRKGELDERYLSNEECKSLGILILDSRGTVAQHQRALEAGRMPPPPPPPPGPPPVKKNVVKAAAAAKTTIIVDSDDENDLSQVASSSRRPVERQKTLSSGPLEPMDCDADDGNMKSSYVPRDVRRNSLEETGQPSQDEEIYLFQPEDNPSILEELTGAELEEAIRQRNAGQLDPRVIILKRRAPALPVVPPPETTSQASTRREKELGSGRSNIAVIHLMADRLKVLEVDVNLNESRLNRDPTYRSQKLDSVISLVTQRRQYLHNTAVKIRTMIVETSARISAIDGFAPLTVKELSPEKKFSDASLVSIRRELAASLLDSQMRLHDLEAGLKQGSYMPAMPPPPPEPRDTVMTSSDEAVNTFDTTTDTTTASRGSVNASDDESDASDQPPDPRQVKGKSLALPLRAPRGVRHHGMLVDDLTTLLHRLEYKPKTKVVATSSSLALVRRHLQPADAMAAASASVKQKVSLAEYKARLVASREKNNDPCNEERRKSIENAVASHAACVKKAHEESEAVVIDESPLSTRSTSPKFSPISAKASDAGSDSITSLEKDTE
ncbi:hypothetical protein BC829DRAFT_414640 [Chytridium lagenaria]|nr:hypothetical protein BC829DRAFT_414640 [Chytridium lagenaria]